MSSFPPAVHSSSLPPGLGAANVTPRQQPTIALRNAHQLSQLVRLPSIHQSQKVAVLTATTPVPLLPVALQHPSAHHHLQRVAERRIRRILDFSKSDESESMGESKVDWPDWDSRDGNREAYEAGEDVGDEVSGGGLDEGMRRRRGSCLLRRLVSKRGMASRRLVPTGEGKKRRICRCDRRSQPQAPPPTFRVWDLAGSGCANRIDEDRAGEDLSTQSAITAATALLTPRRIEQTLHYTLL